MTGPEVAISDLTARLRGGDCRTAARVISMLEDGDAAAIEIIKAVYRDTGGAHVVGITGPPGAGKSTIVDKLTKAAREDGKRVGIVAVDPTSPFSGGALLGDRVRMQEHFTDTEVFIRSMATRGWLGGLARATKDVIKVMDVMGKDIIFVETVGAGQSEVSIIQSAHTTIVVEMPGLGDDIQAIKAGILEIGDIFVVNKADRADAARTVAELEMMLDIKSDRCGGSGDSAGGTWRPPVVQTVARDNKGIRELYDHIATHMLWLKNSGNLQLHHRTQVLVEFEDLLKDALAKYVLKQPAAKHILAELELKLQNREIDPYTAVRLVMDSVKLNSD